MELDAACVAEIDGQLRERLGERQHEKFFRQVTRFETQGDELVLYVGSPYLQSWLQRQFQHELTDVAHAVLGTGARLRLDVDPSLAGKPSSDSETRQPARKTSGRASGLHRRGRRHHGAALPTSASLSSDPATISQRLRLVAWLSPLTASSIRSFCTVASVQARPTCSKPSTGKSARRSRHSRFCI